MILDEPTNHLDIDSRQALVSALNAYDGAVVLVSHDPHLVELVADRLLLVADGRVQPFDGDLADYRRFLAEQAREARRGGAAAESRSGTASRKDERRAAAEIRAQLAPLRKQVAAVEKRLEQSGKAKAGIEAKLADPALYSGPGEAVARLQKELAETQRCIDEAEAEWLDLHEQLEAAQADF
jgi:ATP-binding cassette subfamily F protein 3